MKRYKSHVSIAQKWQKQIPPGADAQKEMLCFFGGMLLAFLFSTAFFIRYLASYRKLFHTVNQVRVMKGNAVMTSFSALTEGVYWGFGVLILCQVALVLYHVACFHTGNSKSMYLMRRLPDRWAFLRYVLTVPIITVSVSILGASLLHLLYALFYYVCTPNVCLP